MTEHDIQCQVIAEAELLALKDDRWTSLFAVPNGARTSIGTAVKLKREGLKKGVPDLMFLVPNCEYHGLAIEMKTKKGRVSPAQKAWLKRFEDYGYKTAVCRSSDEAINVIKEYLEN